MSPVGQVTRKQWLRLGRRFPGVDFPVFVIMPNHVHGIIFIRDTHGRGAAEDFTIPRSGGIPLRPYEETNNDQHGAAGEDFTIPRSGGIPLRSYEEPHVDPGSLGAIVRSYKASVTWRIHAMDRYNRAPVWQRNYYEHIIRNEAEMQRIASYIQQNPLRWQDDQLHPAVPANPFNQEKQYG